MQVRHVFGSEELYLVSESDGQSARKMSGDVSVDDVDAEDDSEGSDVPMTQSLINLLAAHNKKKAKKRKKKPTPQKKRQHALSDDDEDESPTARKTSRRQRLFSADDGAGESKEEEEARKKLRPEPRELWSVPQIGLGECDVSTRIKGVCGAHHRVWFRRADLTHKTNNPRCAPDGPFNDHRCLTWWKNPYAQLEFAERFAIPAQDHMALRPLSTDTRELQIDKDWCSAAIFAFCNTHRPTYLDIPRTPQVQGFCLPQHHGDRKSRMMLDGGANGGLAGVADCLLWKMSVCADTLTVDNEIMQVLTLLCRALRGGLAGGGAAALRRCVAELLARPRAGYQRPAVGTGRQCRRAPVGPARRAVAAGAAAGHPSRRGPQGGRTQPATPCQRGVGRGRWHPVVSRPCRRPDRRRDQGPPERHHAPESLV